MPLRELQGGRTLWGSLWGFPGWPDWSSSGRIFPPVDGWGLHRTPPKLLKQRAPPTSLPAGAGHGPSACPIPFPGWKIPSIVPIPLLLHFGAGGGPGSPQTAAQGGAGETEAAAGRERRRQGGFGERGMICRAGGCSLWEICPWTPPLLSQPIPGGLSLPLHPLMTTIKRSPANEVAFKERNEAGDLPRLLSAVVKSFSLPQPPPLRCRGSVPWHGDSALAQGQRQRPASPKPPPAPTGIPSGAIPLFPGSPQGAKRSRCPHPAQWDSPRAGVPRGEVALCLLCDTAVAPEQGRFCLHVPQSRRGSGPARCPRAVSPCPQITPWL